MERIHQALCGMNSASLRLSGRQDGAGEGGEAVLGTQTRLGVLGARYVILAALIAFGALAAALVLVGASKANAETNTHNSGPIGAVNTPYNYADGDYSDEFVDDGLLRWGSTRVYRARGSYLNRPQDATVTFYVYRYDFGTRRWESYARKQSSANLGRNSSVLVPGNHVFVTNDADHYTVDIVVRWYDSQDPTGGTRTPIAARQFDQDAGSDYRCEDINGNGGECGVFDRGFVRLTSNQ